MTRAMVDTHVLSYAISEPSSNPKVARTQRDSKALLTSLSEVRVSSIVLLEMLRAPPSVVAKLHASSLFDMLYVEPVDAAIAMAAADILERARNRSYACPRCLNVIGATACPECGQHVSRQLKTHDSLIVATAAVLTDVEILYSCDDGVLELGTFVNTVKVLYPPNLDGPLFSDTDG